MPILIVLQKLVKHQRLAGSKIVVGVSNVP
jgi:hypothetical protein